MNGPMTNIRRGTWSHLVMGLCLLGPGSPAPAASTDETAQGTPEPAPRPKIGLALGGGGARGTAHIGVIRALEQMHVQIDYIAGTSMGSIIGGLYACGYTPDGMEKLVGSIDWDTLFRDAPGRKDQSFRQKEDDFLHLIPFEFGLNFNKGGLLLPPGLIAGSKLAFVLENATLPCSSVTNFDQLRIPFRAVATDVQTGEPYVMSSGNLARVIRASMAIPAIFTPVEIDGHELIDGGESQNLPVQTVRAMGADIVIAVNVGSSGKTRAEKVGNVGAMIGRLIDLPLQQNTMAAAKLADFVITPNLDPYTSADFGKGLKMVALGYQAALADKGKLEQWSEPESVYVPWKERHDATLPPMPRIDQVVVDAVPGIDPRRLQFLVHTRPGILDTKTLAEDLKRIYGLGYFEIVSYTIAQDGERTILRITATPKSWGPTYLKLGLNLATDFHLTTDFGFTALVDATEMNRLGGEWKTTATIGSPVDLETRFFQPVNHRGHLFLSPFISWQQYLVQLWNAEGTVTTGTDQVRRFAGGMDIGYDFGTWGELRVGYMASKRGGTKLVGTELANATQFTYDQGALGAQLRIDQLDNVNLPHSGYFADIGYLANRPSLGASSEVTRANGEVSDPHLSDYDLLAGKAVGVQTVGRWTGQVRGEYGTSLGTALPFLDRYTLGGLFRLSGRPIRQLRGENVLFGAGLLYYRVSGTGSGVVKNLSAGVSIEGGTTWTSRTDWQKVPWSEMRLAGSVYVIADTLIGPFFLGYGHSQGYGTLYLYLNRSF